MSSSSKADITQGSMDLGCIIPILFVKAKLLIKADIWMKFHNDIKPLYLETDTSSVGLGAAHLQTW